MGFRFNKRIKIAPGIKLNVGLGGVSTSIGTRGASINVGKRGVRANAGIPGTGLSYSTRLTSNTRNRVSIREQKAYEKLIKAKERNEALSNVQMLLDEESGVVTIKDGNNEPLKGKEKTTFWEKEAQNIESWLLENKDRINGDVDLLNNIHFDMSTPESKAEYLIMEFNVPIPQKPINNIQINPPIKESIEPLGFFSGLFPSNKKKYSDKISKADEQYLLDMETYKKETKLADLNHEKKLRNWEESVTMWEKDRASHKREQKDNEIKFKKEINENIGLMESILDSEIQSLEWPRETLISYSIVDSGNSIWLDVDLPEIEDLPQKTASLSTNKKRLIIKNKAIKQLQLEYAHHIHAIALRLATYCFSSVPKSKNVIISGFSQRLNSATGNIDDDYLYSIKFSREGLLNLNYDEVEAINPIDTISMFEHKRKMSATGLFKKIEPFSI